MLQFPKSASLGCQAMLEVAYSAMRTAMVTGGFLGLVDDASGVESLADGFYYASYLTTSLYFVSAEWAARGRGERPERTEVSE